jgi:hypothetical protein
METNADAVGHGNEASEGTYARALERLHEVNAVPAVLRARRVTHPHLYDRMLASGVTPSYPRPEPPPRLPTLLGAWIAPLLVAAALLLPMRVVLKSDPTYANDTTLLIRVAILGRRSDLRTLARRAQDRGDESAASALRRAAGTRDAGGECEEVQGRMD